MVKIRLKRIGKKKTPYYRVVVSDSRFPVQGRTIADLGSYDPNTDPAKVQIDVEEAKKWLNNGAQPTVTAQKILKQAGVTRG